MLVPRPLPLVFSATNDGVLPLPVGRRDVSGGVSKEHDSDSSVSMLGLREKIPKGEPYVL